jgi:hypothetical protein
MPGLRDAPAFEGHSPQQDPPLGGYAVLVGVFAVASATFAGWLHRSEREVRETVSPWDLVLLSIATHKASRLLAKDRVTSAVRAPFTRFQGDGGPAEVKEAARGRGLRRAIGELLICPYCVALWIAAGLTAGLLVAPRLTRWTCTVFTAVFASDVMQIAYARAEKAL